MKNEMKIERNVPIPLRSIYPFETMKVGECLLVGKYSLKLSRNVSAAIHYFKRKHPDWKFETRKMNGSLRVWRIQ